MGRNNMRIGVSRWLIIFIFFGRLFATSLIPASIEEMTRRSSLILTGVVRSISISENPDNGMIFRTIEIEPDWVLKGEIRKGQTVYIYALGGKLKGMTMKVPGAPEFTVGEKVLVFLKKDRQNRWRVFGMAEGKFSLVDTRRGVRAVRALDEINFVEPKGERVTFKSEYPFDELIGIVLSQLRK
ncbi:hypothetical protein DRP53_11010 [candidate division WOR-3 bacterium]|uniref:Uncharacterized protein n=1 Tax=candidate division WOR-3 bacterium TaxID=2052148 RepID=A0A660SE75_UNCW3|nr:MAG: hypothetical protein DRP53_11010 [candidate division WOR-3 bacterium]